MLYTINHMQNDYLIGIDVGTTSIKSTLFNLVGQVVEHNVTPYETLRPSPSHVEQNPRDWMTAVESALHFFSTVVNKTQVRAIGLTSQVNTHVFLDAQLQVLLPAIVWQDGRAAVEAAELDKQLSDNQRLRWWAAPMPIDASHALARMRWMQQYHPEIWARTRHVLLPKDYCLQQLTGEIISDAWSNIGLVDLQRNYIDELLALVPGAESCLPPLTDSTEIAGRIKPGLPFAGVPIAVGTMDAWAGVFGTGVTADNTGMYLSGTSEILGIVSPSIMPTPGVLVMPRNHDITLHIGPTQSGGASQLWLCGLLDISPDVMSALAAQHDRTKPYPLFLPHLQGERAPLWDASARGVFIGLDASTDRAALACAVYDGVAHSARWLLDSLQTSAGTSLDKLQVGGGGFRSDIWNQIRADILGVKLHRVAVTDPGTLGAAGIGAVAVGLHDSLQSAFSDLVHTDCSFYPDESRADWHAERLLLFQNTYSQTCELSHRWLNL